MSGDATIENIGQVTVEAPKRELPSSINMPDHAVRMERWYQIYSRLARPSLDWATLGWFVFCTMFEPFVLHNFNVVSTGMCLLWAASVYSIKTYEKKAGLA